MSGIKRAIYGITGAAGSGKDTLAAHLKNCLWPGVYSTQHRSFATPLKAAMAAMGLPEPENREDKEKLIEGFDFTWRDAAQKLGTEWGRGLDSNIWTKMAMKDLHVAELQGELADGQAIIFSDVRFDNEAAAICEAGGIVIQLIGRRADLAGASQSHASEKGISPAWVAHTINNSGSVELMQQIGGTIALDWLKQVKAQWATEGATE